MDSGFLNSIFKKTFDKKIRFWLTKTSGSDPFIYLLKNCENADEAKIKFAKILMDVG
jgi:hypothetical protein